MASTDDGPSAKSNPEIRIVGIDTGKTRRIAGSTTVYQVYFELSGNPSSAWRDIFEREWKALNLKQEADIAGSFLVMHCRLHEVGSIHLPALKKAVDTTNAAYTQYTLEQVAEGKRRADIWKEERKAVDEMAKSLRFDDETEL